MPSLLAELQRRNVFRAGAAYIVIAWLLAQVFDLLADNFGAPAWVMKLVLSCLGIGFFVALLLSWAYELTPEGVMRSEDVLPNDSIAPKTGGKLTAIAVVGLMLAVAFLAWDRLGPPRSRPAENPGMESPMFAFVVIPPSESPAHLFVGGPIALSPDGSRLATVVFRNDEKWISVYDFRTGQTNVLESTLGAMFPFWSPDSRWIGFFSDGKLRKVEARGGPAQALADAFSGRGGSWSQTGQIVYAPDIYGPLLLVPENGGETRTVTEPIDENTTHRNPYFLPDGERFLFIEGGRGSDGIGRLMAGSADGQAARELLAPASNVQLSAGFLLFVRNGTLLAQRFDESTLTFSGSIVPVADNVSWFHPRYAGNFSATADGLLVFRPRVENESRLVWVDRDGRLIETLLPGDDEFVRARPSRDLRQLCMSRRDSIGRTQDIWFLDVATRQPRRVTFANIRSLLSCVFSPDGRFMAVSGWDPEPAIAPTPDEGVTSDLWIQPSSEPGEPESVLKNSRFFVTDWSPDGKTLLGWTQRTETARDVTFIHLDDPEPRVQDLVNNRFGEANGRFSPDGAWVAYQSDESGANEVYVVDFPNAERTFQVSWEGGANPFWSVDGDEIIFSASGETLAAPVTHTGDGIEFGEPARLGLSDLTGHMLGAAALGADGERFLVAQSEEPPGIAPTHVIRNWFALLDPEER